MAARIRLRTNLAANLVGTGGSAAIALAAAPLTFRLLGPDAYGLVGVYLLMQGLMPLFDLGVAPGLARAVAWHKGGGEWGKVTTLVAKARRWMLVVAFVFAALFSTIAGLFGPAWLGATSLSPTLVRTVLVIMAISLAVRMLSGVPKATLMALERQVGANAVQLGAVAMRTLGALWIAVGTHTGIAGFFLSQVPISLFEWLAYRHLLGRALTAPAAPVPPADVAGHVRFGLAIAALAALWLLASQADKVAMASAVPLAQYGSYSLGVHIASAVIVGIGPLQASILPRLTHLVAEGAEEPVRVLYGMATALTVALCTSLVIGIWVVGPDLGRFLGREPSSIDPLRIAGIYAIGNSAVALLALSYQLQNARGVMRVHAIGTILQALIQAPVLVLVASRGDAYATACWFSGLNWFFLLCWAPVVHNRFLSGGHRAWVGKDLLAPLVTGASAGSIILLLVHGFAPAGSRPWLAVVAMGACFTLVLAAHPAVRRYMLDRVPRHAR